MSILEGLRAAREAYYEATGKPLLEVHLHPREYRLLAYETSAKMVKFPGVLFLPESLVIDGELEVRPR